MKYLILSISVLLLVSCVSLRKPVEPTTEFDTAVGFKLKPPPNGPWYEMKTSDGTGWILGRERSDEDKKDGSTVICDVRFGFVNLKQFGLKSPKETLKFFKKSMSAKENTDRFAMSKNVFAQTKFKSADCTTFDGLGTDLQAKAPNGEKLIMSNRGMICIHPKDPSRYISMAISQRRPESRALSDLSADERAFYSSLTFDDIKGAKNAP